MYIQPEKILKIFDTICSKHRGEMLSAYLDWEVIKISSPHYEHPIEQLVPMFVVDFK